MLARYTTPFLRVLLFATFAVAAACQTAPPVQEMSDARQAIMAAREAGAAEKAPDDLRAAEEHEQTAKDLLSQKAYIRARRQAVLARSRALDALRRSKTEPDTSN
jgi:hypothetical protein